MPRGNNFQRSERVSSAILRAVATALRSKVKDPRLDGCIINAVEMTKDLSVAHVRWYMVPDPSEKQQSDARDAFKSVSGMLRSFVGSQVRMRSTPDLRFSFDRGVANRRRVEELLSQVQPPPEDMDEP